MFDTNGHVVRGVEPDLARAVGAAAHLVAPHGVELGKHAAHALLPALASPTPVRWRYLMRVAADFAVESTWPGRSGPDDEAPAWLGLDTLLSKHPHVLADPVPYLGRPDPRRAPPRLRGSWERNAHIVNQALAEVARRAVPREVAALARAASEQSAPEAPVAAPQRRWRGARADFVYLDDVRVEGRWLKSTLRRP